MNCKCPYCLEEFKNEKALVIHARMKHEKSSEELYLDYKLQGIRPVCKCGCGNLTKFSRWATGFNDYVNLKHRSYYKKMLTYETRTCLYKKCDKTFSVPQSSDQKFCCSKHSARSESTKGKRVSTVKKKYGVENVSQVKEVQEKREKTFLENYGETSPLKNKKVKEKLIKTNLKERGVENVFQCEKIKEKSKETNLKKLGVEYPAQSEKIQKKTKQSQFKKYGKYYVQTQAFKAKAKKSILKKYSVSHAMKCEEIKNKVKDTHLRKHYNRLLKSEYFTKVLKPLFLIENYKGVKNNEYPFECLVCNTIFEGKIDNGRVPICPTCYPYSVYRSKGEIELTKFLLSLNFNVKNNVTDIISPHQLDLYLPDYSLAIEYNGVYWHSDYFKDKKYHLQKTLECQKHGIRLIQIFEDEWQLKKDIVKNRIKHCLGITEEKIFARKCVIKNITAEEKNIFLDKVHLQGKDIAKINLGLYYDSELVAVMTFSKPRLALGQKNNKKGTWELSRFAAKISIVGGASKLFSYFLKKYNPIEVYSYADIRWSKLTQNVYEALGFSFEKITNPNYWYHKSGFERLHRFNFRKDRLEKKIDFFDPLLTEWENMQINGYNRIWDCGNLKYVWKKESS